MESLFTYLWKSAAVLTLFYCFYKLLLQNETYFKANRYFLFTGLLASIIIPFIIIPRYLEIDPIQSTIVEGTTLTANSNPTQMIDWFVIFLYGYIIITATLIGKFILQLLSIAMLIRKGEIKKIDNFYHVKTNIETSPFSFFNFIVFNPTHFNENELDHILNHEKVHVLQKHSLDTVLTHILTTIQWFNPFVWLYKKDIAENLEFLADENAQKTSSSESSYQQLLLKTTVPNYQMALANNFYDSLLKKRIIMLHKQRSNSKSQWKYALMIPLLLAFVFTFNTKTIAQQKKMKILKEQVEVFAMGISKKSTKKDLDNIVKSFSDKELHVKFNNVKRNAANEITSIKIDAKAKSGKASAAFASDMKEGINPIQISFDNENNNLSIGSNDRSHGKHGKAYVFSDKVKKIIKLNEQDHVFTIHDDNDDDETTNMWITKDGDTTKIITKKKIIEIDKDHDKDHEIIIDENGQKIKKEVIRIKHSKGENKDNFIFISGDDEDDENTITTYIVNGKKMTKEEFKKFDKEKIKTIEIRKEVNKEKN